MVCIAYLNLTYIGRSSATLSYLLQVYSWSSIMIRKPDFKDRMHHRLRVTRWGLPQNWTISFFSKKLDSKKYWTIWQKLAIFPEILRPKWDQTWTNFKIWPKNWTMVTLIIVIIKVGYRRGSRKNLRGEAETIIGWQQGWGAGAAPGFGERRGWAGRVAFSGGPRNYSNDL